MTEKKDNDNIGVEDIKKFIDKANQKYEAFPLWKKTLAWLMIVFVLGASMLVVFGPTKEVTTITYGDGCKEITINGNLTTPICYEGRILKEEYENSVAQRWGMMNNQMDIQNLTLPDLS